MLSTVWRSSRVWFEVFVYWNLRVGRIYPSSCYVRPSCENAWGRPQLYQIWQFQPPFQPQFQYSCCIVFGLAPLPCNIGRLDILCTWVSWWRSQCTRDNWSGGQSRSSFIDCGIIKQHGTWNSVVPRRISKVWLVNGNCCMSFNELGMPLCVTLSAVRDLTVRGLQLSMQITKIKNDPACGMIREVSRNVKIGGSCHCRWLLDFLRQYWRAEKQ